MHLEQHSGGELRVAHPLLDGEHRELDDVRGAALDRRVQCHPLGVLTALAVVGGEVGEVAAASEDGLGIPGGAGRLHALLEVVAHPAEPFEVTVAQSRRLGPGDPELAGQPEGREAVGQAVADRLRLRAHRRIHRIGAHPEHPGSDEVVQILAGVERLDQALILGEVRHDAHLDLRVVGGQQGLEAVPGDEDVADPLPFGGAHGDVLEVRLGGGQPPGRGSGLLEGGVHAGAAVHHFVQTHQIAGQLAHLAEAQQPGEEAMAGGVRVQGLGEVGQRFGVGRVARGDLPRGRQRERLEQHHLQLLG